MARQFTIKRSRKTCRILGTAGLFAVPVFGSALAHSTAQSTTPRASTASQAMADCVVRYRIEAHRGPLYGIYRSGAAQPTGIASASLSVNPIGNGIRVNPLASMDDQSGSRPNSSSTQQGGER